MVLTTLALVLLAGSFNLNRTNADAVAPDEDVVITPADTCAELAGCEGGPYLCAVLVLPDGTTIMCYGKA
jgi:hypothetical protein